jgi:hypothetical protein
MSLLGKEAFFIEEEAIAASRVVSLRIQTLSEGGEEVIAELENGRRSPAERICLSVQELLVQLKQDWERRGAPRGPTDIAIEEDER